MSVSLNHLSLFLLEKKLYAYSTQLKMSWNLSRVINKLEAEISSGYVHNPATRDFSLGSHEIININLVKTEDVETRRYFSFSVNDE